MLLLALQAGPSGLTRNNLIDVPFDFITVVVLLLTIGGPLLIWWANRPSTIERYGAKNSRQDDATPDVPRVMNGTAPAASPRRDLSAIAGSRTPRSTRRVGAK